MYQNHSLNNNNKLIQVKKIHNLLYFQTIIRCNNHLHKKKKK